jgi:hypothetical protein
MGDEELIGVPYRRIDQLLFTLRHLTEAQKAGFHCPSEMNRVVSAIMDELGLNENNNEN